MKQEQQGLMRDIESLGFKQHPSPLYRDDKRGAEYGRWKVEVGGARSIMVTHQYQERDTSWSDAYTITFLDTHLHTGEMVMSAFDNLREWQKEN